MRIGGGLVFHILVKEAQSLFPKSSLPPSQTFNAMIPYFPRIIARSPHHLMAGGGIPQGSINQVNVYSSNYWQKRIFLHEMELQVLGLLIHQLNHVADFFQLVMNKNDDSLGTLPAVIMMLEVVMVKRPYRSSILGQWAWLTLNLRWRIHYV